MAYRKPYKRTYRKPLRDITYRYASSGSSYGRKQPYSRKVRSYSKYRPTGRGNSTRRVSSSSLYRGGVAVGKAVPGLGQATATDLFAKVCRFTLVLCLLTQCLGAYFLPCSRRTAMREECFVDGSVGRREKYRSGEAGVYGKDCLYRFVLERSYRKALDAVYYFSPPSPQTDSFPGGDAMAGCSDEQGWRLVSPSPYWVLARFGFAGVYDGEGPLWRRSVSRFSCDSSDTTEGGEDIGGQEKGVYAVWPSWLRSASEVLQFARGELCL